jgi:hypothetical protein
MPDDGEVVGQLPVEAIENKSADSSVSVEKFGKIRMSNQILEVA